MQNRKGIPICLLTSQLTGYRRRHGWHVIIQKNNFILIFTPTQSAVKDWSHLLDIVVPLSVIYTEHLICAADKLIGKSLHQLAMAARCIPKKRTNTMLVTVKLAIKTFSSLPSQSPLMCKKFYIKPRRFEPTVWLFLRWVKTERWTSYI